MVLRTNKNARNSDIGDAFRVHKNNLRRAVGAPHEFLSEFSFGGEIADLLAERRSAITPIGQRLRELQEQRSLTRPMNDLCSSFVHLHLNRIVWGEAVSEHHILGLLRRTRESLRNAPIKK
jgi:thiopeptide-type bacteriocin biosynthesis protein